MKEEYVDLATDSDDDFLPTFPKRPRVPPNQVAGSSTRYAVLDSLTPFYCFPFLAIPHVLNHPQVLLLVLHHWRGDTCYSYNSV